MYSKYFIKHVTTICKATHVLGTVSFTWVSKKGQYESMGLTNKAKVLFHLINLEVYAVALLPSQILAVQKAKKFEEFSFTVISWMGILMGDVMVGMCFIHAEEICLVFNGYYTFMWNFQKRYMLNQNVEKWKNNTFMNITITISTILSASISVLFTVNYFIKPRSAAYITASIPDYLLTPIIYYPVGIKHCIASMGVVLLMAFLNNHVLSFFFYLRPIYTTELRLGRSSYMTRDSLRKLENLTVTWRAMEMLVNDVNRVFSFSFIPLEVIFTNMTVFGNLICIMYWHELGMVLKLVIPIVTIFAALGWGIFLTITGMSWKDTTLTLRSWKLGDVKQKRSREYLKRFKRSCKPLLLGYAKGFKIKPKKFLGYLKGISRRTLKTIIGLRKMYMKLHR
ncbi:unnamed protein product [Orchesella dallaii]|uniref:Odorant receptor n=1 Tax=Orchesella dallaii TaxID=48710 RepID=A0ABP1PVA7_9HEXA